MQGEQVYCKRGPHPPLDEYRLATQAIDFLFPDDPNIPGYATIGLQFVCDECFAAARLVAAIFNGRIDATPLED